MLKHKVVGDSEFLETYICHDCGAEDNEYGVMVPPNKVKWPEKDFANPHGKPDTSILPDVRERSDNQ